VRLVGHERQARLRRYRVGDDVVAVDGDAAGGWAQDAGDRAERGRLPGAIRADESHDFAIGDVERQIVDSRERRAAIDADRAGIGSREVLD